MVPLLPAGPNELIVVLMRCILLQDGHIQFFSFLHAFPEFKKLVLLVSPEGALALPRGEHLLTDVRHIELPQLATSFTAEQENNEGFGPSPQSEMTLTLADSTVSVLRVFLLPECEKYVFPWSEARFPFSMLAHVIKLCDAVVVGVFMREQDDQAEENCQGLRLVKQWCSHVSTALTIYRQSDVNDIYLGAIPQKPSPPKHWYSNLVSTLRRKGSSIKLLNRPRAPDTDVVEYYTSKRCATSGTIWEKDIEATYAAVMGKWKCAELQGRYITNFKAFITEDRGRHLLTLCGAYLRSPVMRSIYVSFDTCGIPRMYFFNKKKSGQMTISDVVYELVGENVNWSPENPQGKALCGVSRREAECQADYNIKLLRLYWQPHWTRYVSAENVTLIGFPEEFLIGQIHLRFTKKLVFKRLESESSIPSNENHGVLHLLSLEELCMEGTSNDKYKGTCEICAPNLSRLSIVMLPKSTMIWDLSGLLFNFSNSPFGRKYQYDLCLRILHLECKQGINDLSLSLEDIQCVAYSLSELSVKGLRPRFLGDVIRDRVSAEDKLPVFPGLRSLKVSTASPLHYPTVSFDAKDFPVLKVVKLECEVSGTL